MANRPLSSVRVLAAALALAAAASVASAQTAEEENPSDKVVFVATAGQPPFQMRDPGGAFGGFDIAVAQKLSQVMGQAAEVVFMTQKEMIEAMMTDRAHVVIGVESNRMYDKIFDYSGPYLINKVRLFVHEDTVFIHTLKDLSGLRVGVNRGTDIGEFVKLLPGVRLIVEPDTPTGLDDLEKRNIMVYLGDEHETQYYIRTGRLAGIKAIGGALMLKRRSFAVRKGKDELLGRINGALDQMKKDLTIQEIYDEWFGTAGESHFNRRFLVLLLSVLGLVATVLLVTLIWSQKLSAAVSARTHELTAERAHFQNIFDHASDGIILIDPADTTILEANRAAEGIFGFSKTELLKMKLASLEISEDANLAQSLGRVMGSGGESAMFEGRFRTKSLQNVDVLVHARSFPAKGKNLIEAIVRDITERKKIQEMKDTILQDVAHELKTPMSKVAMSVDLMERNLSDHDRSAYARFFDICHRSVSRLQHTIDGILNLSRLEAQTLKVEAEVFVAQDLLMTVMEELGVFAQRKGLALVNLLPREPLYLKGDMEMIRRLFVNIIHNAIKFTNHGSVTVLAEEDKYKLVKISVKDEGIGLEPEDLKKVFTRFYQKNPTYEGCGIGLTIAQKIVSLHSGVIWAESGGPNRGTTMHIMFPLWTKDGDGGAKPGGVLG